MREGSVQFEAFDEATFSYLGATYAITLWVDPFAGMYVAGWRQADPPSELPVERTKTPRPDPSDVIAEAVLHAARHAERVHTLEEPDPTAGMDALGRIAAATYGAVENDAAVTPHAPAPRRRPRRQRDPG